MTNRELGAELSKAIVDERRGMHNVLKFIQLCIERRTYLEFGYPTMFEWLTKGHGYCNASAQQRIESAKLLQVVPQIEEKLKTGKVNLSTLSKAQTIIRAQEKITRQAVSKELKMEIVQRIENKSVQQTEQTLIEMFPQTASTVNRETKQVVNASTTRYSINFPTEIEGEIKRAKEILSHKFPEASDADIFAYALKFMLQNIDPLRKSPKTRSKDDGTSKHLSPSSDCNTASESDSKTALASGISEAPANSSPSESKASVRRGIYLGSGGTCTYKDPVTKHICGSSYQVEIDHIVPKALGGSDDPSNLRTLCRAHNFHAAEKMLGEKKMGQYRRDYGW